MNMKLDVVVASVFDVVKAERFYESCASFRDLDGTVWRRTRWTSARPLAR